MGLLSKSSAVADEITKPVTAENTPKIEKSNTGSLLQRINSLISNSSMDFFDFISKYNLPLSAWALFTLHDNYFYISNSYGFDGHSIISSLSTDSFWNGTIDKELYIYNFSITNDSLTPFYQFLSKSLKDSCKNIYILKTNHQILFLCSDSDNQILFPENFIDDFKIFIEREPSSLNVFEKSFTVSFSEAINKYILSQNILSYNFEVFKTSISKSIGNYLKTFFGTKNVIRNTDMCYVNSTSTLPEDLLLNHIKLNLKEVIGEYTQFISINF